MKKSFSVVGALALLFCASAAYAQGSGNGTPQPYDPNQGYANHYNYADGAEGEWYRNTERFQKSEVADKVQNRYRVMNQNQRSYGPPTPEDVKALVRKFQADREAFMAQQREMKQQMDSATEQERKRIKEQLKEQMKEWKRQQAQLREQLCEQADQLRDQLREQAQTRLMDQVSKPTESGTGGNGPRGR